MSAPSIDPDTGEIRPAPFEMLDVYAPEGILEAQPRPDWIATISAGTLTPNRDPNKAAIPQATRDGTISLHDPEGRAPRLKAALEATGYKRLTVVFPWDDLDAFILQRFTRRSASALEVYGDKRTITQISGGAHTTYPRGTREYRALVTTCKVEVSVLFALAEWTAADDGATHARVLFDDEFGWYRLRFTSRHSLQAIVGKLIEVKERVTGGRLAGLPFELSITYRDVAGPDGRTRHIPVWSLAFQPPGGLRLTSGNLGPLLLSALAEGERLRLPAAPAYGYELAELEPPTADLDEDIAESVMSTPAVPANARAWEARYFALVRGTPFATDEARAALVEEYTIGRTTSLAALLGDATEAEAADFFNYAAAAVHAEAQARREIGQRPDAHPPLDLTQLGDDPGYTRAEAPPTAAPFFDRPMTEADLAAQEAAAAEPDEAPAVRLHTLEQRFAIERLAPPKQLAEVNWETLTFEDAGTWIQSLQSR